MSERLNDLARQAWVRAAETATPPHLDAQLIQRAGQDAQNQLGADSSLSAWLSLRAQLACAQRGAELSTPRQLLTTARWLRRIGWLSVALCFVFGLLSDVIGPERRLYLLNPPLFFLSAWSICVYIWLVYRSLRGRQAEGSLRAFALRVVEALGQWASRHAPSAALRSRAAVQHQAWSTLSDLLHSFLLLRLTAWIHVGAAALATGAIASMYFRGVALSYAAGWESTFLSTEQVHRLLHFLSPASWASGIPLPDLVELDTLNFQRGSGESAARWIHLNVLNAALWVLLPRALLAAWATHQAKRALQGCELPLSDEERRRLTAQWHMARSQLPGASRHALLLPLQYTLNDGQIRHAPKILTDLFPLPWRVRASAPLYSGDDLTARMAADVGTSLQERPDAIVLVASLTATPEPGMHGRMIQALARQASMYKVGGPNPHWLELKSAGADYYPPEPLWLIVDVTAFSKKFGVDRRKERESAWRALVLELTTAHATPIRLHFVELEPTE